MSGNSLSRSLPYVAGFRLKRGIMMGVDDVEDRRVHGFAFWSVHRANVLLLRPMRT
jgi:hypothetical protein